MTPTLWLVLAVVAAAALVSVAAVWGAIRRRRPATSKALDVRGAPAQVGGDQLDPGDLVLFETGVPNQVLVLSDGDVDLTDIGTVLSRSPAQVAGYLANAVDGVVRLATTGAQATGRLVLVDQKFANAMKAGTAAKDSTGEVLAVIRGSGGTFRGVARVRSVGTLTQLTSVTGAVSAVATQAQLARIESALATLSVEVTAVRTELERERDSQRSAARDVIAQVYRTSIEAGTLSAENWSNVSGSPIVLRQRLLADQSALVAAVGALDALGSAGAGKRRTELDTRVRAVSEAHANLVGSAQSWVQFSTLRIWRLTVTGSVDLPAYQRELAEELTGWLAHEHLRDLAAAALDHVELLGWRTRVAHPVAAYRLPRDVGVARVQVGSLPWEALVDAGRTAGGLDAGDGSTRTPR